MYNIICYRFSIWWLTIIKGYTPFIVIIKYWLYSLYCTIYHCSFFFLIYLFMAVLGLRLCSRALSSCGKRGPLFIAVRTPRLSLSQPLPLRSTGSRHAGSAIVAHGPSRSAACGIFPDQGSNPCPLHWQADSQPLHHQGSPCSLFYT